MTDPAAEPRDHGFYWILIATDPEPALWDGEGWAIIGGGELTEEPEVLFPEPILPPDWPVE